MPRILQLEAKGKPVLRGNDHCWAVMVALDRVGPFTPADVHNQTNAHLLTAVSRYMLALALGGYLVKASIAERSLGAPVTSYRIGKRSQYAPSLKPDGSPTNYGRRSQQMWNVLCGPLAVRGIDARDLALYASTEACVVKLSSAKEYCHALNKAGRLVVLKPARRGVLTLYRLPRAGITGPLAPIMLKTRMIYDPNLGCLVNPVLDAEEIEP